MDPVWLFETFGPWFLALSILIIFTECAIFPILPGDSLLFAVGMFIAQTSGIRIFGLDEVGTLIVATLLLMVAAILGNVVGYWVGMKLSPWLFKPRPGFIGSIFSQKHLTEAHLFFERYGAKALVLGRFVPFVRTFVTMVAGAAGMTFRHFITWTAVGAVAWAVGITLLGYFLGNVAFIKDNLEYALIAIVLISVLPMAFEILKERRNRARESA
nr:DedA family protein [Propionibacterium sp.]